MHIRYPNTPRRTVTETLHGVKIADPYRWLERAKSARVQRWTRQQNHLTQTALHALPGRSSCRKELTKYLSIDAIGVPVPRKGNLFFTRHDGRQNQSKLCVQRGARGKARTLLDPNRLAKNGSLALAWWEPSPDGSRIAYGLMQHGNENSTLFVLDVHSGKNVAESIPNVMFCDLVWLPDASGFYYTRMPARGTVRLGEEFYHQRVFFHTLGKDPRTDPVVFGVGRAKEDVFGVELSRDGRYLLVTVYQGWAKTELYLFDRQQHHWTCVVKGKQANFFATLHRHALYVLTSDGSPKYAIRAVPLRDAGRQPRYWSTIIPEGRYPIEAFHLVRDRLFVVRTKNVLSHLSVYSLRGKLCKEVHLGTKGSIETMSADPEGDTLFFGFESFFLPPTIFQIHHATLRVSVWKRVATGLRPKSFVTEQVWYRSNDGSRIPMFLVHKKNLVLRSTTPILLTGYGGFGLSMKPYCRRSIIPFLRYGGVYAVANVRGGGEFGEAWHRAGIREKKQNSIDDFLAAAEWLITQGYTSPKRLAIEGGSNGGLLVTAVLTQRPELFRAVIADVPLCDMLRYEHSRFARRWACEYGSVADKRFFLALLRYSPYHAVKKGSAYPAVLVSSGEQDSRVDPFHSRKMTAALQHATVSGLPVLLHVDTTSGHGTGKPFSAVVEESVDMWSFLYRMWEWSPQTNGKTRGTAKAQ